MRDGKYVILETSAGFNVNLVAAGNQRIIGTSAKNGITEAEALEVVKEGQELGAELSNYEEKTSTKDGKHYFNLKHPKDLRVIFRSEGYQDKKKRTNSIASFRRNSQAGKVEFRRLEKPLRLEEINTDNMLGKYLLSAVGVIMSSTTHRDKAPDEILAIIFETKQRVYPN